jgi:hypothetical protein
MESSLAPYIRGPPSCAQSLARLGPSHIHARSGLGPGLGTAPGHADTHYARRARGDCIEGRRGWVGGRCAMAGRTRGSGVREAAAVQRVRRCDGEPPSAAGRRGQLGGRIRRWARRASARAAAFASRSRSKWTRPCRGTYTAPAVVSETNHTQVLCRERVELGQCHVEIHGNV